MSKFFKDLPSNMEQYNPEAIPKKWHREETFDEDGKLHSYNDLPTKLKLKSARETSLLFDETPEDVYEFRWYNHGSLYRSGNRPPVIRITKTTYSTLNEERNFHSYNGQPANIKSSTLLGHQFYSATWCKNGKAHRKNYLPADIAYNREGILEIETYAVDGVLHRNNSLPCGITLNSKTWMVRGIMHNSEGYADALYDTDFYNWILYGVDVTEEGFLEIKKLSETTNIPLWVSFLFSLEFINQEHLKPFMNSDGKWETTLTPSWILNCWNITESMVEHKNDELEISGKLNYRFPNLERNPVFFTALTRVIQFEENEALLRTNQAKESYV